MPVAVLYNKSDLPSAVPEEKLRGMVRCAGNLQPLSPPPAFLDVRIGILTDIPKTVRQRRWQSFDKKKQDVSHLRLCVEDLQNLPYAIRSVAVFYLV